MKKAMIALVFFAFVLFGFYLFQQDNSGAPNPASNDQADKVPMQNEFVGKVVYTTDMEFDEALLKEDCARREGRFDQCGSICEKDAEMCGDVCAYTCEFDQTFKPSSQIESPVEEAELRSVGVFEGSGIATRDFDGMAFIHTVTVFLEEPDEGKFYEGWLVKNEPEPTFFSTGRLEVQGGGYGLVYSASQDRRDFNEVVITIETESSGLDGIPEIHVLEGEFK